MIVRTGLTGAFPRSEGLVRATRDFDRGRASQDSVEALYRTSELEVVALEQRLGFSTVTAGYLRWPDLFRAFAETWEGFSVGPLTRWFETNTFYRQPILFSPPLRIPGAFVGRIPPPLRAEPASARILLPGPYTFAGLLENRSGETDSALVHRLGRLLADEVRELRGLGFSTFQFTEPLLVVRPPDGPHAEAVVEAYGSISKALNGGTSIVWTFGKDALPALRILDRLPASVVGIDLADTDVERIPAGGQVPALGLGVLDPRTTLPEDPTEVVRVVRAAAERRGAKTVWLGPGASLDLLPPEPATRKLEVLSQVQRTLSEGGKP
jgi:5-methyltetrahydropteroyltriglutamate--homocysteine methyltransferase